MLAVVWSSVVNSLVRGAASASLWGLRVYGLGSPRACRCCGTEERSIGILHSGNPSCVEGGM